MQPKYGVRYLRIGKGWICANVKNRLTRFDGRDAALAHARNLLKNDPWVFVAEAFDICNPTICTEVKR